jgi:hypothetical protein
MRLLLTAALLILAREAPAEPSFEARLLASHNAVRAETRTPRLTWNAELARDATAWAQDLSERRRMEHSPASQRVGQGENLWMGTAGAFGPEAMVGLWAAERRDYVAGVFPKVSLTRSWSDVGHYTQMAWRQTREVGCGLATDGRRDYLVCRYSPPGNVIGQRAF